MWNRSRLIAVLTLLIIATTAAAIEADTNIRLDPNPDEIGFYINSTYITCIFTNQEAANVTIKFERFNTTDNSIDLVTDFGEFAVNQTSNFTIMASNYSMVGQYRVAMYAVDSSELCSHWIVVRSNTSGNYEALHGSVRFTDADSIPSVSFIEPMSGRGTTWTTDSISLTHSLELYVFESGSAHAAGMLTFSGNTSDGETVNISTDRYEFDNDDNITSGNIAVDVSGGNNNSSRSCELFAAEVTANDTIDVGATCAGSVVTLTADATDSSGNSIITTETCVNATFASATLTGGGSTGDWTPTGGGNITLVSSTNTSGNLTNWLLPQNYTLGRTYMMLIYSHDYELLDVHVALAVVPTSNVVTVIAQDAETNEQILTYTATMMDITKTASAGEVTWANVTNGEHLITVQADNYATDAITIYMANSYINETVYLLRSSPYIAPHHVKFKVMSVFGVEYQNIHTDVSYTTASGENASMNGTTGSDGSVTFLMTPSIQYTLTFINATQGISETITIYPKDTEYYIYIDSFSWTPPENQTIRDTVDWGWTSERINTTHGWINFTYTDTSNETTYIDYWINTSNDTNLYTFNTTYPTSWTVNQIVEADNKTYIAHFSADHPRFGSLVGSVRHTVVFRGIIASFGWGEQWMYDTVAICAIIFIGLLFSATSVNVGAVVCVMSGWLFVWMGWLSGSTINYGMMVLATVIAVGFAMRKGETMKA